MDTVRAGVVVVVGQKDDEGVLVSGGAERADDAANLRVHVRLHPEVVVQECEPRVLVLHFSKLGVLPILIDPLQSRLAVYAVGRTVGNLAAGGVAGSGGGTDQVLLLRSAGELHTAPLGAHNQVPVEDRTRLPPVERRARTGSLRRKELERLAPSCDPGDAGVLLPDPRNFAQ